MTSLAGVARRKGRGRRQCCMRNLERMYVREETSGAIGMQQRHNNRLGSRNTQQDLQADRRAGDRKANSLDFH
jgi:hypothetical protein